MITKRNKKNAAAPGTVNLGAFLDGDIVCVAVADPSSGRITPDADTPSLPVSRVVATLPTWSANTRPVDLTLLRLQRYPIPSNFEIARRLVETAERADDATQVVFNVKSLDSASYDFVKTNGHEHLYLTTAPAGDNREALDIARRHVPAAAEITTEPRMHAIWRAAASAARETNTFAGSYPAPEETPVVAVLAVDEKGYGFAIGPVDHQSPVYAPEELADEQMQRMGPALALQALASGAADLLADKMEPSALTDVRVNARAQIATFVACDAHIWDELSRALEGTNIPVIPLNPDAPGTAAPASPAKAAARGAAIGTLVAPGETVNLSDPLPERVSRISTEFADKAEGEHASRVFRTLILLFALPLITAGWMLGSWWSASSEVASLTELKAQKQQRSRQLQAAINKRNEANLNLAYCQDLSKQIFLKRGQQPAVAQLMLDLNSVWPRDGWYVSGTGTVAPAGSGTIEIRGRAKTFDTVTAFTDALEKLKDESGANKFENIRPGTGDVAAGGSQGPQNGPLTLGSAPSPSTPTPATGARVVGQGPFEWSVQTTYVPLVGRGKPAGAKK